MPLRIVNYQKKKSKLAWFSQNDLSNIISQRWAPGNSHRQVEIYNNVRYLSVLLQVVVQDLRVGLLVRCQDVHEGGWGVGSSSRGVDGSPAAQS